MMPVEFFSATVTEADRKFEQACLKHGLEHRFYTHPQTGPNGEALNLGVCRLGPADADNRLLVLSATHGIEGYAGAGIQSGWLQQFGDMELPDQTSVVMVHLLNPWGVAWNRRENEDNIDVFRNVLYCDHPSEPDPLYDRVDDALDLEHWPNTGSESRQKQADVLIAEYGIDGLIAAIRRGQHHRPKGMTYHGDGPCWSKSRLDEVVVDELTGAKRIAVIDIHTGFGEYGEGLVMSYDPPGSDRYKRVTEWFSGDIYTPGSDANIPDHTSRLPFAWIESMLSGSSVTAEILEFGTFDPAEIGEIFNANHHYHVYGDPLSPKGLEWGSRYRRYCYPEEDEWKHKVWRRGVEVIETTLAGLSAWSRENEG